ncbi:glycosyltransferase [Thermosphaera chiliense]|uniref:Glycosyltransferase n=1 Tax=Thermosphaera chiliense TaxID=3402707 RepID=A0A7M1USP7_9CREN|nr:glycosyltransferase [Thermosphaera aggregans]QOR94577.1 glycosyltransferase [Thermosphaera aggregans]
MSKANILVITSDPWLDRLHGASVLRMFRSLADTGYKVRIIMPSTINKSVKQNNLLITTLEVKNYIPLFTLMKLYASAFKILLRERPKLIIFDYSMLPIFFLAKTLLNNKGIMLILSRPVGESGFRGFIRFLNFKLSLIIGRCFVDLFTAITPFEAYEFSRIANIPLRKFVVIPSPLGDEFVKFSISENINEIRPKLGLQSLINKKILLYHGSLDKERGIMQIIKLFYESFKENSEIVLLLAGTGTAENLIREFIKQNRVNNIIILPPVPFEQVPILVSSCDVGLVILPDHPWWRYQCPTKLVEYLALGKPVIASDLPGIRWVAGKCPLVMYIKSLKKKEFEEAVSKALILIREPSFNLEKLYAQKYVQRRFGSSSIALKLGYLIDSLINKSR